MTPVSVGFQSECWKIRTKKDTSSSCCLNEHVGEVAGPEIPRGSKNLGQTLDNCLPVDGFKVYFFNCFILEMSWACLGLLNILTLLLLQRHFSCQQFDFLPAEEWQHLGSNRATLTDVVGEGLGGQQRWWATARDNCSLWKRFGHLSGQACVPQLRLLINWQAAWVGRTSGGEKFVH